MLETIAAFWAEYGDTLIQGTVDTLLMVSISTVFAYLIGLPLGVALIMTQLTASDPTGAPTASWTGSSMWAAPSPSSF